MKQSIIFFDIDGTIINETTGLIPESTKKAIKKAKLNGHLTFINTGRSLSEISDSLRELDFDGYICGCGTYIEYKNEEIFYTSLGNELSKKIVRKIREYNLDGILEGKNDIYYDININSEKVRRIKESHIKLGFYRDSTFDNPKINFDKFVIWTNASSDFESFYEGFKDMFEFIKRDIDFYEIVPLGYSKASGIKYLIDYLNIPFENTYAIGDSTNDLSMLEYVQNSIAMGNSNHALFDLVSFTTKDIEEDGISYALEHYGIISIY